jgi:hypothetical protein
MKSENAGDSHLLKQAADHFVVLKCKAATAAPSIGGKQSLVLKIQLTCYASGDQQQMENNYISQVIHFNNNLHFNLTLQTTRGLNWSLFLPSQGPYAVVFKSDEEVVPQLLDEIFHHLCDYAVAWSFCLSFLQCAEVQ